MSCAQDANRSGEIVSITTPLGRSRIAWQGESEGHSTAGEWSTGGAAHTCNGVAGDDACEDGTEMGLITTPGSRYPKNRFRSWEGKYASSSGPVEIRKLADL